MTLSLADILARLSVDKTKMVSENDALPGRDRKMRVSGTHAVLDTSYLLDDLGEYDYVAFGMGCFWGVERVFWESGKVYSTAVGYVGGITPNPTYEEVCSGQTGHNEAVLVIFDSAKTDFTSLLSVFWENHDPSQGMRQGNDQGTQYRSGIYCSTDAQLTAAKDSAKEYDLRLNKQVGKTVTTEIMLLSEFYFAEEYHQQYLHKNPGGYCNLLSLDKTGHPSIN